MNLLLLREGYPPVAVRPEDRKMYLGTLEHASVRDDLKLFQIFMHRRLDATFGEYLSALQEGLPNQSRKGAKPPRVRESPAWRELIQAF